MRKFISEFTFIDWFFAVMVALLLTLVVFIIAHMFGSETITLRKDDWSCTETRREKQLRIIGKVNMLVDVDVCSSWRRT